MVSNVLEMTFVNRRAYWTRRSDETFPTRLDRPCDATRFDYYLGAFSF